MLKQQARLIRILLVWIDLVAVALASIIAHSVGCALNWDLNDLHDYMWILVLALPVWHFSLVQQGLYSSVRRLTMFQFLSKMANVHFVSAMVVSGLIYVLQEEPVSRKLFLLFVLFSFLLLTIYRLVGFVFLRRVRRSGYNTRNILIVGVREKAQRFNQLLAEHADWGLHVVGFLQVVDGPLMERVDGYPVLGREEDLFTVCKQYPVDEVVFCVPGDYTEQVNMSLQRLEELGITVRIVVDFWTYASVRKELNLFHDELPIVTFHTKTLDAWQLLLKRMLDLFGASVGLLLTALAFPFIAPAIKFSDPGPIFFSQERVGESGRLFRCWKFRSMYTDAEERKKDLMAQNEMSGAIFKIKNDPRIFPFGHFLRKTSLDELPQFWNVFKGEMSLVGTRPPTPAEVDEYQDWHRRRISIKPGITGLWQVSGRNAIEDFDEIVRLDLHYIDHWSLWSDILLLLRTVKVVVMRDGSR